MGRNFETLRVSQTFSFLTTTVQVNVAIATWQWQEGLATLSLQYTFHPNSRKVMTDTIHFLPWCSLQKLSSDIQDDTSTTSRDSITSSSTISNTNVPGSGVASTGGAANMNSLVPSSSSDSLPMSDKRALFQEKVRQSNEACQNSDFPRAIRLYTEALELDPANHILYSNRSAAHVKLKDYERALTDAIKARELNPKWAKVRIQNFWM